IDLASLLPRPAAAATVVDVGNLHHGVDVEERVKDFVVQAQLDHSVVGNDLVHLFLDGSTLLEAPKIVDVEKATSQEVFAQLCRFVPVKVHAMGRDDVEVRITEQLRIHGGDQMGALVVDTNVAEPLNAPHELAVGCGKVGSPSAAKPRAALTGR